MATTGDANGTKDGLASEIGKRRSGRGAIEALIARAKKFAIEETAEEVTEKEKSIAGLLALCGSGKDLWADEHADEYVARLREGWD